MWRAAGLVLAIACSLLTGTLPTWSSQMATSTPVPAALTSRDAPVPFGSSGQVGRFTVQVEQYDQTFTPEEWAPADTPPTAGQLLVRAQLRVTYTSPNVGSTSSDSYTFDDFDLKFNAVGRAKNIRYTENLSCEFTQNGEFNVPAVFPGGSVDLDVCWIIDPGDASTLTAYVDDRGGSSASTPLWLSLDGALVPGTATPVGN